MPSLYGRAGWLLNGSVTIAAASLLGQGDVASVSWSSAAPQGCKVSGVMKLALSAKRASLRSLMASSSR